MSGISRGGLRPGAGRKPRGAEKRLSVCITVTPETKRRMDELRASGVKIIQELGEQADAYVKERA